MHVVAGGVALKIAVDASIKRTRIDRQLLCVELLDEGDGTELDVSKSGVVKMVGERR